MNLLQETKDIQKKMALFCRTGKSVDLPGLTPDRFHHYRRLVYNIILDNLESAFPIAYEFIEREKWLAMANEFFRHHPCQSYQVWQIPGEFYEYAVKRNFSKKHELEYLNDLLKFEWEEMLIYNMEDIEVESFRENGDVLNEFLVLNPEHKLLELQYPVHLVNPPAAIEKKGTYFVLLYREHTTGKVQFMDLSIWCALVIEQLVSQKVTMKDLFDQAPALFGEINLNELKETTFTFIKELRSRSFILGFKK